MRWARKSGHCEAKIGFNEEESKVYCDLEAVAMVKCGAVGAGLRYLEVVRKAEQTTERVGPRTGCEPSCGL